MTRHRPATALPPACCCASGTCSLSRATSRPRSARYAPHRIVLAIPADAADLPPALADKTPRAGPVAYLCLGSTCSAPIDSLDALIEQLREDDPQPQSAPA